MKKEYITYGNSCKADAGEYIGDFVTHEVIEPHERNAWFHFIAGGINLEGLAARITVVPEEELKIINL